MKITALVMGVTGGVLGLLFALLVLLLGLADSHLNGDSTLVVLSVVAFAFAVLGIVGGALVGTRAGWSALLMLTAGLGITFTISAFGIVPGLLFLLGALFAAMHRRGARRASVAS